MKTVHMLAICASLLLLPMAAAGQGRFVSSEIPDDVIYGDLFLRVARFVHKAESAEKVGKSRPNLRHLVRKQAGLTEEEGQLLEQIALQCERDVAVYDLKAKGIIERFRATHPYRMSTKRTSVEAPPSELRSLWSQRASAILLGRERLRSALGEASFSTLDRYQRDEARRSITPTRPMDVGEVPGHKRLPAVP